MAVVTQKLIAENRTQLPKLQILIYPWIQMINLKLPSHIKYFNTGLLSSFSSSPGKFIAWYLGIQNLTDQIETIINTNLHYALINNHNNNELKLKINKYLDINRIDKQFRSNEYYNDYDAIKKYHYPLDKLDDDHLLKTDKNLANLLLKLYSPEISPILADDLSKQPNAYFAICEWDTLKDEGLLYAERLKSFGVQVVHIDVYEDAYHGIWAFPSDPNKSNLLSGYKVANKMVQNIENFIRKNL